MNKYEIIALQEAQLNVGGKCLSDLYLTGKTLLENNNNLIADAIDKGQTVIEQHQTPAQSISSPLIDMDGKANMNTGAQISGVVDNGITSEVFGNDNNSNLNNASEPQNVAPSLAIPPVISNGESTPTSYNVPMVNSIGESPVPYSEPEVKLAEESNSVPYNVINDDYYVKCLNALRDKLTSFYNDMNMELDKLQEQTLQKSGVNLVDNVNLTEKSLENPQNSNVPATPEYSTNVGENIFNIPQPPVQILQPTDLEKTVFIPRDVMNNAISETSVGMSRAA